MLQRRANARLKERGWGVPEGTPQCPNKSSQGLFMWSVKDEVKDNAG